MSHSLISNSSFYFRTFRIPFDLMLNCFTLEKRLSKKQPSLSKNFEKFSKISEKSRQKYVPILVYLFD